MTLIISDASVLIDMEDSQLTSVMFSLPWKFTVPDVLFAEELIEQHSHLLGMGLISKSMTGDQVAEAYLLHQKYKRPSVNDMLALTLAKAEGCHLLTGDLVLRKVAEELSVDVHGTLWLVERMLEYKKVTIEVAGVAFQRMKSSGRRLPWGEVEKILNRK